MLLLSTPVLTTLTKTSAATVASQMKNPYGYDFADGDDDPWTTTGMVLTLLVLLPGWNGAVPRQNGNVVP